jgi:hypothetical protein
MKTNIGIVAIAAILFTAAPFCSPLTAKATVKPHKVTLVNLTIDAIDTTAKTITAHDSTPTTYTINASRAKIRRATGEKATFSGLLEFFTDDSITVWGKTTDGMNISGTRIRNNSTRRIKGKYITTIANIYQFTADDEVPANIQGEFLGVKDGNQLSEIIVYKNTKYKLGKKKITFAGIQAGDVVDIQGILRTFDSITLIFNTTLVQIKSHGPVPTNFLPTFKPMIKQ